MSRRAAALVAGAGLLAALALPSCRRGGDRPEAGEPSTAAGSLDTVTVELQFPNAAGWLGTESRELPAAGSAAERCRQIATALLDGPSEPAHRPPLAGAAVAGVYLSGTGVVFLDLTAAELGTPPVSGSRGELLAVYSFVNSILANVPEARSVVLLWNGNQRPTFAGHVDTTRPLRAEEKWRARG